MKTIDEWLNKYAVTHQHPVNRTIHIICVPLIFWSMIGLAWAAPVARHMQGVPFLDWATLLFVPILMFYLSLGWRSFVAMLFLFAVCGMICIGIEDLNLHLGWTATAVFVIAWIGQFYGHKVEGAKPAFLDDIKFLLIGPIWTVNKIVKLTR